MSDPEKTNSTRTVRLLQSSAWPYLRWILALTLGAIFWVGMGMYAKNLRAERAAEDAVLAAQQAATAASAAAVPTCEVVTTVQTRDAQGNVVRQASEKKVAPCEQAQAKTAAADKTPLADKPWPTEVKVLLGVLLVLVIGLLIWANCFFALLEILFYVLAALF